MLNMDFSKRIVIETGDELLGKAGCKLKDLDVIGFGQGPGSFTGVRISVAIAQGLAYSTNLPLVGVSTLAVMAQQTFEQFSTEVVYSSIDARMGEIYFAQYHAKDGLMTLKGEENWERTLRPSSMRFPR